MNWRDAILQAFAPQAARLTVIADPDGLLLEEDVSRAIRQRGFELAIYEDALRFRYLYESRYRKAWDAGEALEVALAAPGDDSLVETLPFDWLAGARRLRFSLQSLFPNLHPKVVQELDRALLDALYQAQAAHPPPLLSEQATCDFILRHVFEIAAEAIHQPADLLRMLARRHHNRQQLSPRLEKHLLQVLSTKAVFQDWPLAQIIPDRQAFLAFLQERWPIYLGSLAGVKEARGGYSLNFSGPPLLPFEQDDVRVYITNFFVEGWLKPIAKPPGLAPAQNWPAIGITYRRAAERLQRLERLFEALEQQIPGETQPHSDWTDFALRFAEFNSLWHALKPKEQKPQRPRYQALQQRVDANFQAWLSQRYSGLATLPGVAMGHHIVRALRNHLDQGGARAALLVLDGLALDQWVTLREALSEKYPGLELRQEAVFAWLPTLTSVSRQAIFAGRPPMYFANSIHTTDKEEKLWKQYWAEAGVSAAQCAYLRGLGDMDSLNKVNNVLDGDAPRVLGLVVDTIDKIMHGMQLGADGMHNQVRQWTEQGFLARLLDLLLAQGFLVFLTADHGSIEAKGCGKPGEGASADLRGERARIYSSPELRSTVQAQFPGSLAWPAAGLPSNYLPLLAAQRSAFISPGKRTVAHGGAALEEVIAPLIQISQRK